MNFFFSWVLDLFKKPETDVTSWPLPAPVKAQRKRRAPVKKKPATKITAKKTKKKE